MEGHQSALIFSLGHMTIEGMVTMGVLFVLSLLSWAVIFNKWIGVLRQRRASKKFHAAVSELEDTLSLDVEAREKEFAASPSLTVYEAAREEVGRQRAQIAPAALKPGAPLPGRGLGSLRAVLQKTVNEEAVRLESGTVVLAMAISGGPFIGLTGTVFGVMETFSGVAQAGQANLSAMAPGVAGALVNTIVGLVVAIPALFAYNLLTKSIQAIQIGMEGFSGDLEARIIAEQYSARDDGSNLDRSSHRHEPHAAKLAATH